MRYPVLPLEAARQGLEQRRAGEPWSGRSFVHWVGEGPDFDEDRAVALLEDLSALKSEIGLDPLPKSRGKDFEAPAAALVHEHLGIEAAVAGSRDFWLWFTFVAAGGRFADLVDWRFSSQDTIAPINYGITGQAGVWEGLFARLWWRGNVGHEPGAEDPYRVARKGDVDLWRSHIIRQEYGQCVTLARALVNYQYPDDGARRLTVEELRELAKRLRIVHASMSLELLDEDAAQELIEEHVERIRNHVLVAASAD